MQQLVNLIEKRIVTRSSFLELVSLINSLEIRMFNSVWEIFRKYAVLSDNSKIYTMGCCGRKTRN